MNQKWLRIDEQKPEQNQPVFYYFGVFDRVYEVKYISTETDFGDDDGTLYEIDYFGGMSGFLGDDVTYWMPRADGDEKPADPTPEQKATCLYHPTKL